MLDVALHQTPRIVQRQWRSRPDALSLERFVPAFDLSVRLRIVGRSSLEYWEKQAVQRTSSEEPPQLRRLWRPFSSGEYCFRCFFMRSLRSLNGGNVFSISRLNRNTTKLLR